MDPKLQLDMWRFIQAVRDVNAGDLDIDDLDPKQIVSWASKLLRQAPAGWQGPDTTEDAWFHWVHTGEVRQDI